MGVWRSQGESRLKQVDEYTGESSKDGDVWARGPKQKTKKARSTRGARWRYPFSRSKLDMTASPGAVVSRGEVD